MAAEDKVVTVVVKEQTVAAFANLRALCKSGYGCDVVLAVGEREFPAHKIILAGNSEYFKAMFGAGLSESTQKRVEMKYINADILESIVDYCYGSPISIRASMLLDLLAATDMLQFPSLKKECCPMIERALDVSNCVDVYDSATLFRVTPLRRAAFVYMMRNFRALSKRERFWEVGFDVFRYLVSCSKLGITTELDVFNCIENWCQHKPETRKKYFVALLKRVRLGDLPVKVVVDYVRACSLVKENLECLAIVTDAISKHALHNNQPVTPPSPRRSLHKGEDLFVIGGEVAGKVSNEVFKYSSSTKSWIVSPPMRNARCKAAAAVYLDKIYVYGGKLQTSVLHSMELFSLQEEVWRTVKAPAVARESCGFCECDGWLYAVGGRQEDHVNYLKSAERYDPVRDK